MGSTVTFRVTEDERAALALVAEAAGVGANAWAREAALEKALGEQYKPQRSKKPTYRQELARLHGVLVQISGQLQQLLDLQSERLIRIDGVVVLIKATRHAILSLGRAMMEQSGNVRGRQENR